MQDSAIKAKVDADIAGAKAAGLDHTPTYYLNGTEIANPANYEEFKKIIDNALQKAA
jgi:protein-disulfide isomerase